MNNKIELPAGFKIDPALFYDAIVKSTDDYLYVVDMDTDIALISDNMQRDFELPGRLVPHLVDQWGKLVHERDKKPYYNSIEQMLSGHTDTHHLEYQVRNRSGEYVWIICRGLLKRDETGAPRMFAGVVANICNRGKVDFVTGLFIQMECERMIELLLEKETLPAGLLMLGLDDFSAVNHLNGHSFGDAVLRQFAQDIQRKLPANVTMYRFDNDAFLLLCRGYECDAIDALYQKIKQYGNRSHEIDGISYYCSASGGIAMLGQNGDNYPDLIQHASSALEAAKQRGKNTCVVYTPQLLYPKLRSLQIINQLRESVLQDMRDFSLVYQPLTQAGSMKISGAEALLRWNSASLGAISPQEFIPLLEQSNLIVPVGKWALEEAVRQCKKWAAHTAEFEMNVNISYLQLLDDSFIPFVIDVLDRHALDPARIVLELTESRFVTDRQQLKHSFDQLRQCGIRFAMDDFGTGYSSLAILSEVPADIVKIDRAFISAIDKQEHAFNRSFIGAVVQLCHSVGISVCVEGVEQREELETAQQLRADSIQGFYISRPISSASFEQNLLNQKQAPTD